ncbi:MAG: type IV pilin protein [Methylobacter sp.]|nr:type IV pilin protein [Methylobacter sp.]
MHTCKRSSGFTLMELMIVVAIIGILTGIAYPSYTAYVIKGKRSDAKAALLQMQIAQEKYRANCPQYATAIGTAMSCVAGNYTLIGSTTSPDAYYTIAISGTPTATAYTVTAAPLAPFADSTCGTFAVNKDGKTTSASVQTTAAKVTECWGS